MTWDELMGGGVIVWIVVKQVSKLDRRRKISAACWSIGGAEGVQKLQVAQEGGSYTVPSLGKKRGLMVFKRLRKLC